LLLACGKSEQGMPSSGESAGSSTGGVTSASGGTGNSAGSAVSTGGGAVAHAGNATTGGNVTSVGGQAQAGTTAGGGEASDGGAASCSGGYHACGCGCCGGQTSRLTCVYPELGDDLAAIIAADLGRKSDLQGCSAAGCSIGVDYVCCESPAPSVEQATYTTSLLIGGINRIDIHKMTADCSTLTLRQRAPGAPAQPGFPLETPAGWEMERATRLACPSSAVGPLAIGAVGNITLRVLDDACVADVHLALFFSSDAQTVDAERFDVDALAVDLPAANCH
jgi:hypothetical protein